MQSLEDALSTFGPKRPGTDFQEVKDGVSPPLGDVELARRIAFIFTSAQERVTPGE